PGIEALSEQELPLRLALSVHAAEEGLRTQLMPVNERYPLRDVIEACRAFYARKRRRVLVEYVMLAGVNDSYAQALELARVLAGPGESATARGRAARARRRAAPEHAGDDVGASGAGIFKVNLIPYNPIPAGAASPGLGAPPPTYRCSTPSAIA